MSDFPSQGLRPTHIGSMSAYNPGNHVKVPKRTMIKHREFMLAKTPWMYRKHFVKNHQVLTVTYFQHIQIITMKHQSSMQPPLSTLSHHHPIVGWALLDIGYLQALTPEPKRRSRQDWFLAGATRGGNGAWREHQIEQGVTKKQ